MASMLSDLASFLTNAGVTPVKQGQMPDNPNVCVTIYEYPGLPPDTVFGAAIDTEHPRVQVVSRGEPKDYNTPRLTAETAYRAMANAGHQVIAGTRYLALVPLQSPYLLDKDSNDRLTFAFNCSVFKGLSA